ncbi:Tetratricopeptide-like helical [Penicillium brevicompactum]|uniref:non-specific serine/threonine protein kinase n=1 Tax=Penicillium brevicompactum TaxID=5074 RepID=A0A9W9RUI2_PENBR|nr:Tetratricopeptide-like helical [Penicillium brevicompactum]
MARISDLIRDSQLETQFRPGYTVHLFQEPEPDSDGRVVTRREWWHREQDIGVGGFGRVYLEKCIRGGPQDGAVRAVKQISINTRAQIDYNRELEAIAKFSQPQYNIRFVKSFGWYKRSNQLFIAMEYLEIGDLATYLDRRPPTSPLPENEAQQIAYQILHGLNMMHCHDFAHRDLKPHNILIKRHPPGNWLIKLADFGLSKRDEGSHGNSLTLKGTPGYMAPELWGVIDRGTDYACDIWALGAVIHEILTKKPAFANDELFSVYRTQQRFPDTMLIDAGVSQMGVDFVVALMRLLPNDRLSAAVAMSNPWIQSQFPQPVMSTMIIEGEPCAPSMASMTTEGYASWNTNPEAHEDIQQSRLNSTATMVPMDKTPQQTSTTQETRQYSSPQTPEPTVSTRIIAGEPRAPSLAPTRTEELASLKTIPEPHEDIQQSKPKSIATVVLVNNTPKQTITPQKTGLNSSGQTTLRAFLENQAAASKPRPSKLQGQYWTGDSLYREGRYKEAEKMFQEVLQGRESILGYDHEGTLDSAHWLGITIYRQEEYEEAECFFRQALKGREKVLGYDHKKTLESADWLGDSFFHQKRHKEAERMFRRGLQGREKILGYVNEETAHSAHWVGHSLFYQQRYEEAEIMYRRALRIRKKVLGYDHQQTLCSALWLGHTFIEQGRFEEAQKIFLQTLRGREKTLGSDHKDTQESLYYYGGSLNQLRYASVTPSIT